MTCPYYSQSFATNLYMPDVDWFLDDVLDTPVITSPKDGAILCVNSDKGVTLRWNPVPGAEFYVLQVCMNASFNGATLHSYKVLTNSFVLTNELPEWGLGRQFNWRVSAIGNSRTSEKTDARTFTIECAANQQRSPNQDHGDNQDFDACSEYNVHLEILGNDVAFLCEKQNYEINVSWLCVTGEGLHVNWVNGVWTLHGDVLNPGKVQLLNDDQFKCTVAFNCDVPQIVTLQYCAEFQVVELGLTFFCCVSRHLKSINSLEQQIKARLEKANVADANINIRANISVAEYKYDRSSPFNVANFNVDNALAKTALTGSGNFILTGPVTEVSHRLLAVVPNNAECQHQVDEYVHVVASEALIPLPLPWHYSYLGMPRIADVRFILDGALTVGGSASATVQSVVRDSYAIATVNGTITVYDDTIMFFGGTGYPGFAMYDNYKNHWVVNQLYCYGCS